MAATTRHRDPRGGRRARGTRAPGGRGGAPTPRRDHGASAPPTARGCGRSADAQPDHGRAAGRERPADRRRQNRQLANRRRPHDDAHRRRGNRRANGERNAGRRARGETDRARRHRAQPGRRARRRQAPRMHAITRRRALRRERGHLDTPATARGARRGGDGLARAGMPEGGLLPRGRRADARAGPPRAPRRRPTRPDGEANDRVHRAARSPPRERPSGQQRRSAEHGKHIARSAGERRRMVDARRARGRGHRPRRRRAVSGRRSGHGEGRLVHATHRRDAVVHAVGGHEREAGQHHRRRAGDGAREPRAPHAPGRGRGDRVPAPAGGRRADERRRRRGRRRRRRLRRHGPRPRAPGGHRPRRDPTRGAPADTSYPRHPTTPRSGRTATPQWSTPPSRSPNQHRNRR